MNKLILPAEEYILFTTSLADNILHATYLDTVIVEGKNGDLQYTEEAQSRFEEHLDMVCANLKAHNIFKEGE